jgi:hypothetical protein
LAGGRREAAISGGRFTEEEAVGDGAPPVYVAGCSSCNWVLEAKDDAAVLLVGSEGDGRARRWPVMTSRMFAARASERAIEARG